MYYIRYPISFRQVDDILHERGIDICHETLRFRVNRFGAKFTKEIRMKRLGRHPNWKWHLDESFVKMNGERFYLWRTVDHEGEVIEFIVTTRRNKAAAKQFPIKIMRKHGYPKIIAADMLSSYGAAFREIGNADRPLCGGQFNNRCENSHLPFRRRVRAMQRFKTVAALQKFVSYHSQIYIHYNHQRHLESKQSFKQKTYNCSHEVVLISSPHDD